MQPHFLNFLIYLDTGNLSKGYDSSMIIKIDDVVLAGKSVILEPLTHNHRGQLLDAALTLPKSPVTVLPMADTVDAYMDFAFSQKKADGALPLVMLEAGSRKVIGCSRYFALVAAERKVEIGYTWISKAYQRTIINTEAKYLMLEHAFEKLDFLRVEFCTDYLNFNSRRAIERIGGKLDGVMRYNKIMPDGRVRDTAIYSIIAPEWINIKKYLSHKLNN